MAKEFFDNPPALTGDEKSQLVQLQRYLFTLSDKLNNALTDIDAEQIAPQVRQSISKEANTKISEQAQTLKSLIIKTADIVRSEIDEITAELHSDYVAHSELYGDYEQYLTGKITATADGILQQYGYDERITALEDDAGNTEVFMRRINQYIFSGLIDEVNGKYGIAIGEDVTAYDEEGNPYLNSERKMATFTMDRLSFWQGETELAYFSDEVLHVNKAEIMNTLKIGNHSWMVLAGGAMALTKG